MAKVTDPSFKFWFDEKYYTEQGASTMFRLGTKDDVAAMRAEYTRMRDVAQKRIKRLGEKYPESKTYKYRKEGFLKLKDIAPQDFAKAFSDLARFVKAKASTVTGQKSMQVKTISSINKNIGYSPDEKEDEEGSDVGLNKDNYWRFIKILEKARKMKIVYDSEKMVTVADTTMELNKKQFNRVLTNLEKFVVNSEKIKDSMSMLMAEKGLKRASQINMNDLLKEIER